MPIPLDRLIELLEHLDGHLESCDHSLRRTRGHLKDQGLNPDSILPWLAEHGGYCDCEVLANVGELAESLRERPRPARPSPAPKRPARDLTTLTGWNLQNLPKPWQVANLYNADQPLTLQMGKKAGCSITLMESPLPPGDPHQDEYWTAFWLARTKLPPKTPFRVTRDALKLPASLRSTLVQTAGWIPVYCWITSEDPRWYLEVQTELNRQQGDLPQVAALVTRLASGQ